jgi:hypothetical protein
MKANKIISLLTVIIILSFSFLGLLQVPENINKSFSMIKTVMPYPGKTVVVINKFIRFSPFAGAAARDTSPMRQKEQKKKNSSGLIFYLLSSLLVCNEKALIIFMLLIAVIFISEIKRTAIDYRSIFVPPDIWYYRRWRLKFLTPIEKCIKNRADEFDINPIMRYGWAFTGLLISPHFVRKLAECGLFLYMDNAVT